MLLTDHLTDPKNGDAAAAFLDLFERAVRGVFVFSAYSWEELVSMVAPGCDVGEVKAVLDERASAVHVPSSNSTLSPSPANSTSPELLEPGNGGGGPYYNNASSFVPCDANSSLRAISECDYRAYSIVVGGEKRRGAKDEGWREERSDKDCDERKERSDEALWVLRVAEQKTGEVNYTVTLTLTSRTSPPLRLAPPLAAQCDFAGRRSLKYEYLPSQAHCPTSSLPPSGTTACEYLPFHSFFGLFLIVTSVASTLAILR